MRASSSFDIRHIIIKDTNLSIVSHVFQDHRNVLNIKEKVFMKTWHLKLSPATFMIQSSGTDTQIEQK